MAKLKIRRNPTRRYEAVYIFDSALDDAVTISKALANGVDCNAARKAAPWTSYGPLRSPSGQ